MRGRRHRARSLVIGALVALSPLVVATTSGAQTVAPPVGPSSKTWVGQHEAVEAYLKTAEIERCEEIPVGVTQPRRCYFKPGGLVRSIAWKPLPPGRHRGFWDSYKAEIAAYAVDKLLGLDMVPPYVERRIKGELGAAAMWVEETRVWRLDDPVRGPDVEAWNRQVVRMKMFDNLIGNTDRNAGNLLVDRAFNLILIDHSRAFTSGRKLVAAMTRIDPDLWQRIEALTLEQLSGALKEWIDRGQIRDLLLRRDEMRKVIDRLVADKGEAALIR
jgi:hypothetical protein